MTEIFIRRELLAKDADGSFEILISISKPVKMDDGLYYSTVIFSEIDKYNTTAKGVDEFHSVGCALAYVEAICENSTNPEFFSDGESLLLQQ